MFLFLLFFLRIIHMEIKKVLYRTEKQLDTVETSRNICEFEK